MPTYMTELGWPVEVNTTKDIWGDETTTLSFSDDISLRHYGNRSDKHILNLTHKITDKEGLPDFSRDMAPRFAQWEGKHLYVFRKKDGLYERFTSSPYDINVQHSGWCYGDSLYYSPTGLVTIWQTGHIPYEDIKTGDEPLGIEDFTYSDLESFYEVHMVEFFQNYVAQKYHHRIQVYSPRVSSKFQGKISLYKNKTDKKRDRLSALRPGRAFKAMFPEMSEKDVADLVDKFNMQFPVVNLTLKTGKEEEDFIKAYSYEQSVMQNVYTTCARKSLANSCMRFRPEHENLPKHPAAAYASGDFLSIWTEDDGGRIASRCVLWLNEDGKPQAGPVYGTSELAIDMIEEHLKSLDAVMYDGASWLGAKLLYIPCNGGALAPYLDHEKALKIKGDFLVVGRDSSSHDFYADTYSGVLGGNYAECYECEEQLSEDEVYTDEDGRSFCECCYNERYATCYENCYETYPRDDMDSCIVTINRWGQVRELVYDPASHDYHLIDNDWYHPDLVVVTEQGDAFVIGSEGYFECDQTGELHNIEEAVTALIGTVGCQVSKEWATANDYVLGPNNIYLPNEQEEAA